MGDIKPFFHFFWFHTTYYFSDNMKNIQKDIYIEI